MTAQLTLPYMDAYTGLVLEHHGSGVAGVTRTLATSTHLLTRSFARPCSSRVRSSRLLGSENGTFFGFLNSSFRHIEAGSLEKSVEAIRT